MNISGQLLKMPVFTALLIMQAVPITVAAQEFTGSVTYTNDIFSNLDNGLETGTAFSGLTVLSAQFDQPNFSVYGNINIPNGTSITERFTGDFAAASNIDMLGDARLQELWLERQLDQASLRFGMLAADTEFWASDYADMYISSAFGAPSIVSANLSGASIFPVATLGIRADWKFAENKIFRVALLDGDAGDPETDNRHGLSVTLGESALLLAELDFNLSATGQNPQAFKVSGYYHSGDYLTEEDRVAQGTWGLLLLTDRVITEKLRWFGRAGFARKDRSTSPWSLETGIHISEAFGSKGTLGLAVANIRLNNALLLLEESSARYSHETIVEATYEYPIGKFLTIQPDLQYIINTGGNSDYGNALAAGLRGKFVVDF